MAITESQGYGNAGGAGNRLNMFTLATTGTVTHSPSSVFDGSTTTAGSFFFNAGQAAGAASLIIAFLGKPRIIDGFTLLTSADGTGETWGFEGWDGSAWVSIQDWALTAATSHAITTANATTYSKYRWINKATNSDPNWGEMTLSISGNEYEAGDRTGGLVTVTTTLTLSGTSGAITKSVNGSETQSSAGSWWPTVAAQAGKAIQFDFADSVVLTAAYWAITTVAGGNNGVWKWQRWDGAAWIDVSSNFTWSLDLSTAPHAQLFDLGNAVGSTRYRMLMVSGNTSGTPFYQEVYFDAQSPAIDVDISAEFTDESEFNATPTITVAPDYALTAAFVDETTFAAALTVTPPDVSLSAAFTDEATFTATPTIKPAGHELSAPFVDETEFNATPTITPLPVGGPYFFGWADALTTFDQVTHAVEDIKVFNLKLAQTEGDFATLEVTILNPRIGLLNSSRKRWLWMSKIIDNEVVPIFYGRLVGIPDNIFDTLITLNFQARPEDFVAKKAVLAQALRVRPFYDSIFIDPQSVTDDDAVLEAYSALYHIDRVTHEVTISDVLVPEDGVIELQTNQHFYDGMSMSLLNVPLRSVTVNATLPWTQSAAGGIDLGSMIARKWPLAFDTDPGQLVTSFTFDGLQSDWPKAGSSIGSGWVVGNGQLSNLSFLATTGFTFNTNLFDPSQIPAPITQGSVVYEPKVTTSSYGGIDGSNFSETIDVIYAVLGWGKPTLTVNFATDRDMAQNVVFTMKAAVQDVATLASDDETLLLTLNANSLSDVDAFDNSIPIGDVRARDFVTTPRGRQALEHLALLARANLCIKARCVAISAVTDFNTGLRATLRTGLLVHDERLPGQQAVGKMTGYEITADGDTGAELATLSIGSAIGYGGSYTESPGEPTYADTDYCDNAYQEFKDTVKLVGAGDTTLQVPEFAGFDDGIDFQKGLNEYNAVLNFEVDNPAGAQRTALLADPGNDQASVSSILQMYPSRVSMELIDVKGGPFLGLVNPIVQDLIIPQQINLEADSAP